MVYPFGNTPDLLVYIQSRQQSVFSILVAKKIKSIRANTEAALQRCSYKKMFWKYAADLHESTHAKVWF